MNHNEDSCEHREQHSRAQRVNASDQDKNQFNLRGLPNAHDPAAIHRAIIEYQFQKIFVPQWFGTIQWSPFILDSIQAEEEAKHFNTKFFCALLDVRPKKIPTPPSRPRIIWFHEKAPTNINPNNPSNPKYRLTIHSHFHLEQCPDPYNSFIHLDWLIRNKVAKGFHRFSTRNTKENKGFVLKPWVREHHAHYNLKDYYRYKYHQDSDLILDPRNSDLQFHTN